MRRRSLIALGALAAPAIISLGARAQTVLPAKSYRIFVGFEPGGGADLTARAIATQFERRLSRHVVVENRPGSSGGIPGELMKKATPDGSQLALLSSTTLVARLATKDFPFDPFKDVAPVIQVGNFSIALAVSRTLGVSTFDEYLQWLKGGDAQRHRVAVSSNVAFIEVLNVLLGKAIGQTLTPASFGGDGVLNGKDGRILVDKERRTSAAGVWAGGDCVYGGDDLTVGAVEDGKQAARSIDAALKG